MKFNQRLKRLLNRKSASSEASAQISIPQAWVDQAQMEAGLTFSRDTVEAARSAEKRHSIDITALRETMLNQLTIEQLDTLAEAIGVDAQQLAGGKGRRVLALLQSAEKTEQLPVLLAACRSIRPNVAWQATDGTTAGETADVP